VDVATIAEIVWPVLRQPRQKSRPALRHGVANEASTAAPPTGLDEAGVSQPSKRFSQRDRGDSQLRGQGRLAGELLAVVERPHFYRRHEPLFDLDCTIP
jgi:hypothetical protein